MFQRRRRSYDLKSELGGLAAEPVSGSLVGIRIIFLKDGVVVWFACPEQMEDDPGEFVGSRRDC